MDFPVASSVILVFAVAFWLVGITPILAKRSRRPQPQPIPVENEVAGPAEQAQTTFAAKSTPTLPEARMSEHHENATVTPPAVRIRIRKGRTGIALLGAAALLLFCVSFILGLFSLVTPALPLVSILIAAGSVVTLRQLAKRDARRRAQRRLRDAASTTPAPTQERPAPVNVAVEPFDAAAHEPKPELPQPLTAAQLRTAALAVAEEIGDTTWEPVEVPKPLYVDAPKAERKAPEPLALPEAPKPESTTRLKDAVNARQQLRTDIAPAPQNQHEGSAAGKDESVLRNLDAVLQRRRA